MKSILIALLVTPLFTFAAQSVPLEKVLSAVTVNLNDDGGFDRAVLVEGESGDADLYVYLSDYNPDTQGYKMNLALFRPQVAFNGSMWGQQATLSMSENGGVFDINSLNEGVGRSRWNQTVSVVFKDGQLYVGGYKYSYYDTVDLDDSGVCEIDLMKGTGNRNGKAIQAPKPIPLSEWTADSIIQACDFDH